MDAEGWLGPGRGEFSPMLIGHSSKKPNLKMVRRIKLALHEALELPDEAMITVTQLACLEEDCAPLETVIGLLRPGVPQRQHKIHKATDSIDVEDLLGVCPAWGQNIQRTVIDQYFKEH